MLCFETSITFTSFRIFNVRQGRELGLTTESKWREVPLSLWVAMLEMNLILHFLILFLLILLPIKMVV